VIAGLAAHEYDVQPLQRALDEAIDKHLHPLGLSARNYELHVVEIKSPARQARVNPPGDWSKVPARARLAILKDAYSVIKGFVPFNEDFPLITFGAVVDRRHRQFSSADRLAYDHVLHRFDETLQLFNASGLSPQRGLVIHDRRLKLEREIQTMTALWQRTGARLDTLAQVPLFVDSKASRLVQAADLVAYALWRYYSQKPPDQDLAENIWQLADERDGVLTGVIHLTPDFRHKNCGCPPCTSRY
jgi:Protein of unknown function (DUF3800)